MHGRFARLECVKPIMTPLGQTRPVTSEPGTLTEERKLGYLPSANEVCEGCVFTPVCQSFYSQGGVCLSAGWDTHPPH